MTKKQTFVTPPMTVRYAYLVTPSTTHKANGQYTVKVAILDGTPEAEEFKAFLTSRYEEVIPEKLAQLSPAQKNKLVRVPPWQIEEDRETGEETGFITMTFSMDAKVVRKKDGKVFEFQPDLFDAGNKPLSDAAKKNLKLGAGSTVRVSYTADRGYCMEGTDANNKKFMKSGLSVDLKAVKILSVQEYGASAGAYGFSDEDEGEYTANDSTSDYGGGQLAGGGGPDDFDGDNTPPPSLGDGDF